MLWERTLVSVKSTAASRSSATTPMHRSGWCRKYGWWWWFGENGVTRVGATVACSSKKQKEDGKVTSPLKGGQGHVEIMTRPTIVKDERLSKLSCSENCTELRSGRREDYFFLGSKLFLPWHEIILHWTVLTEHLSGWVLTFGFQDIMITSDITFIF